MNSRNNSEKDSKQGWGRRDNRQQKFKKDFSGQDFYSNDWKNKNNSTIRKPNDPSAPILKVDKHFNVSLNYNELVSINFRWIDNCLLD